MSCKRVGIAFAVSVLVVGAAQAADLRMLSSWDKTNPAVGALAEAFAKGVEAQTKGSVKFIISGPETVPPFEFLALRFTLAAIVMTVIAGWRGPGLDREGHRAGLIAGFMALGLATLLIGLVVIFPLIGHATWHAFRDLVRATPDGYL